MPLLLRQTTAGETWVARPNRISAAVVMGRLTLVAAAVSLVTVLAFTTFGAVPVLPFAGLEIASLWLVLNHWQRHMGDEERIDIAEASVTVTRSIAGRCEQFEFPRYWLQLRLETARPSLRIFIRAHGQELEIGRLLPPPQRQVLADKLKNRLGPQQAQGQDRSATEETP